MPKHHNYKAHHRYSSNSSESYRSPSPRHHRHAHHKRGTEAGLAELMTTFDAPSFKNWVIIPGIVLTIVFYLIGFPLSYSLTHGPNRMKVTVVDKDCKQEDKSLCPTHEEYVAPATAYLITAFLAPALASAIVFFVYKIAIFVRNPRVAAGYYLTKGILKK